VSPTSVPARARWRSPSRYARRLPGSGRPTTASQRSRSREPAVALARPNVARHGLDERVEVLLGDLLAPAPGELDLVVANLPYHAEARARGPAESACSDQPAHAISAPGDGLGYYRELLEACRSRLNGGGALAIQLYGSVLAAGRGQLDELAREIETRAQAGWESRVPAGSGERKRRWSADQTKGAAA
jgi:hypothetical protein